MLLHGATSKLIIQCDFDGTIITNNLSLLLRERFAGGRWRAIEADYLDGRLTVEESNRRQYLMIKEPRGALESFVARNIKLRPGFLEFVSHCRASGFRLAIVSSGLDFYIEAVLKNIGAPPIEVYCGRAVFGQGGIIIKYIHPEGHRVVDGFKRRCLEWFRKQGNPVIYIGDGLSDLDAATGADYAYATDHLHRLLEEASVPHYPFSTFTEILSQMNWLSAQE